MRLRTCAPDLEDFFFARMKRLRLYNDLSAALHQFLDRVNAPAALARHIRCFDMAQCFIADANAARDIEIVFF